MKSPLTEQEALCLKTVLERAHKDEVYLSDIMKFMGSTSVKSLNIPIEGVIDEELLYVGFLLVVEKYSNVIKEKILKGIDETMKKSFQKFDE